MDGGNNTGGNSLTISADQIEPRQVRWLFDHWLPLGFAGLIDGDGGIGKTTVLMRLAADATLAGHGVVIFSGEDDLRSMVLPRLMAAGADLPKVAVDFPTLRRGLRLPRDADTLYRIVSVAGAKLVVIDTIDHHSDGNLNQKRFASDLMRVTGDIARDTQSSIVFTRHLSRARGPAHHRGTGSVGIHAGARFAFLAAPPPGTGRGQQLVLAATKMSMAPKPASRVYRLVSTPNGASCALFEGSSELEADELGERRERDPDSTPQAIDMAIAYLREVLKDEAMPVQIVEEERPEGVSIRTLWRARTALGVVQHWERRVSMIALPEPSPDDEG